MQAIAPWRTIRARLVILVALAVIFANLATAMFSVWQEASRYGAMKRDTLLASAQTLAAAAARGVAAGDQRLVYESIRAIGRINGLTYVGVDDVKGRHLADLGATEQLAGDLVLNEKSEAVPILEMLTSRSIELSVPVVQGGETVGRLTLLSDTSDLAPRLWKTVEFTLLGIGIALVIGLGVALRMQGAITRPLVALTNVMSSVSERHDYGVTLTAERRDEIGVLVEGFNHMISGIRERDGKLARHRESLEQEVADRTRELVVARDAAESANVQKSEFLATMSHEIRTPMNGMLVMAELLASTDLPTRSRRYAEVISSSGQSLLAIINDILDFSKIEAGKLELELLAVDPVKSADTVLDLFYERARSKSLDLVARVATDVPEQIAADPVRLNQVLGNLVNNALKFTETGGVTLSVERDVSRETHIRFAVTDTGIGIPEEKLATIFDAFSQADQSTTRKYGGTGLGLSICRKLVIAMGGEIEVTSDFGRGSTFAFSIPCVSADAAVSPWPKARAGAMAIVSISAPLSANVVAHFLERSGYAVARVEADKVARLAASADLVIADAQTLVSAALPTVKRSGKALALTRLGEASGERCMSQGFADACLGRPVSRAELAGYLERLTSGAPLAEGARGPAATHALKTYADAKVLVADDSAVNREVAIEALSRFGVSPDLVEDGRQAMEACGKTRYDLVLMDGSMPNMDGFEASRAIRAAETEAGLGATPIIALTAHVVGAGSDAWREAGMDGVLHKPFTVQQLGEVLARYLATKGSDSAAPATPAEAPAPVESPPIEGLPVIDPKTFAEFNAMASTGFVGRVVKLYRDHAPKALADIETALASGELEAIGRAAHALKSMSLNIGARRVADSASRMESAARKDGRVATREEATALAEELTQALDALAGIAREAA